ncbi:MAG: hypothetical protein N2202_03965 [Proteobacteria bacterium]|nr:hypothetical protein [Pseudomonadota bacterium]
MITEDIFEERLLNYLFSLVVNSNKIINKANISVLENKIKDETIAIQLDDEIRETAKQILSLFVELLTSPQFDTTNKFYN